jgi:hypothetical protein
VTQGAGGLGVIESLLHKPIVSDRVCYVADLLRDVDAVGAMHFVELVRVADEEVHRASFRIGRSLLQEHLHLAEIVCFREVAS